jgi:hypothetical protein
MVNDPKSSETSDALATRTSCDGGTKRSKETISTTTSPTREDFEPDNRSRRPLQRQGRLYPLLSLFVHTFTLTRALGQGQVPLCVHAHSSCRTASRSRRRRSRREISTRTARFCGEEHRPGKRGQKQADLRESAASGSKSASKACKFKNVQNRGVQRKGKAASGGQAVQSRVVARRVRGSWKVDMRAPTRVCTHQALACNGLRLPRLGLQHDSWFQADVVDRDAEDCRRRGGGA